MGFVWSAVSEIFYSKPEIEFQLVIIGFHNAGKTTIIRRLIHGDEADTDTVPTIGLDTKEFSMKNVKLKVWDLSG
jgi:GTPase SAR1 family protein